MIVVSHSRRTFFTALALGRLAPPAPEAIGERFPDLLVLGIDHELVGTETWFTRIVDDAPDRLGGSV